LNLFTFQAWCGYGILYPFQLFRTCGFLVFFVCTVTERVVDSHNTTHVWTNVTGRMMLMNTLHWVQCWMLLGAARFIKFFTSFIVFVMLQSPYRYYCVEEEYTCILTLIDKIYYHQSSLFHHKVSVFIAYPPLITSNHNQKGKDGKK